MDLTDITNMTGTIGFSSTSISLWPTTATTSVPVHHVPDNSTAIEYTISPLSDKILAIVIAILAIFGVFMNIVVLWNLFGKSNALNKPSRQLHGNIALANFIILLVCVPAISLVLFPGKRSAKDFKYQEKQLETVYCNISGYAFNVLTRQTIHLSTTLALDRLLAVQCPIFHKFRLQKYGYKYVLIFIWLFNLVSCAAPFYVQKLYVLSKFECVCSWQITWLFLNPKRPHYVRVLILIKYFFFPFTLMNLLTVFSSIWVIAFLLRKNLVIKMPCWEKSYQKLSTLRNGSKTSDTHMEGIEEDSHLHQHGHNNTSALMSRTQSEKVSKQKDSVISIGSKSIGRFSMSSLPSKMSTIKRNMNTNITITADAKIKRACITMILVVVLQLICYSVLQLLILDNFLYWVSDQDIFHGLRHKYAVISVIMINYPIMPLIFSILNPAIIHFRLIRSATAAAPKTPVTGISRL